MFNRRLSHEILYVQDADKCNSSFYKIERRNKQWNKTFATTGLNWLANNLKCINFVRKALWWEKTYKITIIIICTYSWLASVFIWKYCMIHFQFGCCCHCNRMRCVLHCEYSMLFHGHGTGTRFFMDKKGDKNVSTRPNKKTKK